MATRWPSLRTVRMRFGAWTSNAEPPDRRRGVRYRSPTSPERPQERRKQQGLCNRTRYQWLGYNATSVRIPGRRQNRPGRSTGAVRLVRTRL